MKEGAIILAVVLSWRRCEREATLFDLKEDTRNQWVSYIYNTVSEQLNTHIGACAGQYTHVLKLDE